MSIHIVASNETDQAIANAIRRKAKREGLPISDVVRRALVAELDDRERHAVETEIVDRSKAAAAAVLARRRAAVTNGRR